MRELFVLMASYNTWMNAKIYKTASELSVDELRADKGAFFGSVWGTLNHIAVGDRIWLQRFAEHPSQHVALAEIRVLKKPQSLDEMLFADLDELMHHRTMLDGLIERCVKGMTDSDLDHVLCYTNTKGVRFCRRFSHLLQHVFNHQTHHRGQVTTLLSQFGKDVGVTDLFALLPNQEDVFE